MGVFFSIQRPSCCVSENSLLKYIVETSLDIVKSFEGVSECGQSPSAVIRDTRVCDHTIDVTFSQFLDG